jgi:hypothetical protein
MMNDEGCIPYPFSQVRGVFLVAPKAQCPDIGEVALAPPFDDRKNVVRVPETAAFCMNPQLAAQCLPFASRHQLKSAVEFECVQSAGGTDPVVTGQNLLAQIRRV